MNSCLYSQRKLIKFLFVWMPWMTEWFENDIKFERKKKKKSQKTVNSDYMSLRLAYSKFEEKKKIIKDLSFNSRSVWDAEWLFVKNTKLNSLMRMRCVLHHKNKAHVDFSSRNISRMKNLRPETPIQIYHRQNWISMRYRE